MSFSQKVKSALWTVVDTIACNITQFVKNPGKEKQRNGNIQVNLSMTIKICFTFLSDHVGPGNVNDLISRYILPIRPDRTYARQLQFQSPASFAYRFV